MHTHRAPEKEEVYSKPNFLGQYLRLQSYPWTTALNQGLQFKTRGEELGKGVCGSPGLESEDLRCKRTASKMPWHIIRFKKGEVFPIPSMTS